MFVSSWFRSASKRQRLTTQLTSSGWKISTAPAAATCWLAATRSDNVLRYHAATGAFVDEFLPKHSGGLNQPSTAVRGNLLCCTTGERQVGMSSEGDRAGTMNWLRHRWQN